ncbi:MAG: helix-turn-helix domain-containing protein [Chloroflexota bacterium]
MMDEFILAEIDVTVQSSFGQWLRQRRQVLDLTREDLAQRVGCAVITLKKIEADERRPSKQMAELFAEHLHIPAVDRPAFIRFARSQSTKDAMDWETPFRPPTNLPVQPTVLIGRDDAVATLHKRLLQPESHLLTLTGPPGIGKTQLALAVAAQVLDDFPDGVFFVALAPIADANQMMPTIAGVLGLSDTGPQTPLERLKVFLRDKQMLLLLDNFEQLLAGSVQIAELLAACPWLKLLVTSRAPLRIRQERQIPVLPLALPDLAHLADIETVTSYAAVTFFLERAQAVKPDFSITPDNTPAVAALCARLDGLPLAIELISVRVKLLPPAALLERLSGRLLLQSDGLRDLEPRHRTLNAAIDWSYQLLSAEEQALFRRLGVFVGGWTLEAAEAVCLADLSLSLLDGLASLLDKNLVKQETESDGEPRFRMLETLREYALGQLSASGELDALRQRHVDYFLKLAETAEAQEFGREQIVWFDRLEDDLANLRAALAWSSETETGLRLASALGWFFTERSHWNEGFDWLEHTIAANPEAPASLRAKALHTAGALGSFAGNKPRAQLYLEQSLALARAAGDRWNLAWALSHLGNFLTTDLALKAALQDESLMLFRELDDAMGITHSLVRSSWRAFGRKDYAHMRVLLEEAEVRARQAGDKISIAWITFNLGQLAWHQNQDLSQARTLVESSLPLYREARFQMGVKNALVWLGQLELTLGNLTEAQTRSQESLLWLREIEVGDPYLCASLGTLAHIASARGQFERAVQLLAAIQHIDELHMRESDNFDNDLATLRAQLGETAFTEAWEKGRAMTLAQVVAYALADEAHTP